MRARRLGVRDRRRGQDAAGVVDFGENQPRRRRRGRRRGGVVVRLRSAAARWRRRAEGKEDVRSIRSFASRARDAHGEPEQVLRLTGHLGEVTCVAFGRDAAGAACAASGSLDHAVMLWNLETGTHLGILAGHLGPGRGRLVLQGLRADTQRVRGPHHAPVAREDGRGCAQREPRRAPGRRAAQPGTRRVCWRGRTPARCRCGAGSAGRAPRPCGQSPQAPNLFKKGHTLSELSDAESRNQNEARDSGETRGGDARRRRDARRRPNPFAFDGQAHKGAVTCIASFARARHRPRDTSRSAMRDANREMAAERAPAVTGGADGYVRVVSAGARDAGG